MSFTTSLISSLRSPSLLLLHGLPPSFSLGTKVVNPKTATLSRQWLSTSYVRPAAKASSPPPANDVLPKTPPTSASEIVSSFYAAINGNDLPSARDLIAQDCVYEDLIFSSPFIGRTAILGFFGKFIDATSTDMQFVIDDISKEDSSAVGVSWHLDIGGLIGRNIINDIKEKREVKFGSHVFLTDCREKTSGVLSYACDETTLRFEPGSDIRATASGSNPTCIKF